MPPRLRAPIERRHDAIVAYGLAFHGAQPALARPRAHGRPPRRGGHDLPLRLATRNRRFLADPLVPFTNSLAERDAGMMKVQQYILTADPQHLIANLRIG